MCYFNRVDPGIGFSSGLLWQKQKKLKHKKKSLIGDFYFLVFIFIPKEIFIRWIIRPNLLDDLVTFTLIFERLQVFYNF